MKAQSTKKNFVLLAIITLCLFAICIAISMSTIRISSITTYAMENEEELNSLKNENNSEGSNDFMMFSSSDRSDNLGLISGNETSNLFFSDLTNVKYIPNANYFLINPWHHDNDNKTGLNVSGVCTTVALQMLMGYHNYYSDRRIIPTTGNDRFFLDADYGNLTGHPAFKRNLVDDQGCHQIGTTDDFFHELYEGMLWPDFPTIGQAIGLVKDTGINFMIDHTPQAVRDNISLTTGLFSKATAQSDIDEGRPILLVMHPFNSEASFHVVPAYGYAQVDGVDGFLVHYGWGDSRTQVWVPSSWMAFQMRMSVNHTHNFVEGADRNNTHRDLTCSVCGLTSTDNLYNIIGGTITGVKYSLSGTITIPSKINIYSTATASFTRHTITDVSDYTFANQTGLTQISIPTSITNIGNAAFKNCYNLTSITSFSNVQNLGNEAFFGCSLLSNIYIPNSLTNIGEQAFANCNNLNITVSSSNPNYSAQDNILYNKNKTKLIFAGKASSEVTVLDTVTEIAPYAFENNFNIYKIYFKNNVIIGNKAFNGCSNINSAYFYSYDSPTLGNNCFPQNSFTLYTPYISQSAYQQKFAAYTSNIDSLKINVIFNSNGVTIETREVYYGSIIENLIIPQVLGYTFNVWYDNSRVLYENGDKWEETENLTLQAELVPIDYTVSLNTNGGVYNGASSFSVEYYSEFPNQIFLEAYVAPTKVGYTFEGWYDANGIKYMTVDGMGTRLWDKASNTTLTAHWAIKSYEIQINNNGTITWLGATGLSNVPCSIEYGTIINAINLISVFKNSAQGYKEGRIFDHFEYNGNIVNWTTIPDLGENEKVVTIIPKWILEKHTIYFNTLCEIVINPIIKDYDTNITLPNVNRNAYIFNGWYTAETGGTKINWTKMPDLTLNNQNNGSITLFAQCTPRLYNIKYELDGGINHINNPISCTILTNFTILNATKVGHIFNGWYLDYNFTNRITKIQNIDEHITLYAYFIPIEYTIRFNANSGVGGTIDVKHTYKVTKNLRTNTFTKAGYNFAGWATSANGNVVYANSQPVVNLSSVKDAVITLYAKWNIQYYYVKSITYHINDWQTNTSSNQTVRVPFNENFSFESEKSFSYYTMNPNPPFNQIPASLYGVFSALYVKYLNGSAVPSNYYSKNNNNVTLFANCFSEGAQIEISVEYKNKPTCVADGSLITLADGSQKAVEDLTGNEQLLVWNLLTGTFDTAPILFIDSDPESIYEVINLGFSDGTSVKVISEHAFWDFDLNKYVFLRNDAAQYIGHWFNKQTTDADGNMTWTRVKLTSVDIQNEETTAWSPVTYGHLCYYVNGMLSMPGATEGLINIFDIDPETMKIDEEKYLSDIEEYGLLAYEEVEDIMSEETFNAFGGQYLLVSIGKGLTTWEEIYLLLDRYAEFF